MRIPLAGLWRSPDFVRLWAGQAISLLGSHIGGGALRYTAILLLAATPAQISLLSAAALLPALLLALPAGLWVDRVRRRPVLVAADVGRALLLLSIPLAYALGALRVEQLYVVAALVGCLTVLFDTAYPSFVPSVVRRDELIEANSKLSASDSLAEIAGPPLGGALVQVVTAPLAIVLDSLSFLGSALALRGVRAHEPPPAPPEEQLGLRRELAEGLAAVRAQPALRALLGIAVIQGVAGGIIGTLYDLYLIRELGLTPALVGLTIGAGGVSALLGAFIAERVARRMGLGRALVAMLVLWSATSVLLPLAQGPWAFATLMVMQLGDVLGTVFAINALSLRQTVTPDRLLGRVNASFNLASPAAALVGVALAGTLGESIGLRASMAVAVAIGATSAVWLLASPVRRMRAADDAAGDAVAR